MSIPSRLGRYVVRRRIGSGGFATVWLAYDEHLDSPVAVKVLADNWTEDHHVRTRFLEEGRYLRRVESPHVVSVYDAGELDDGRPYLVMSYADQGTLADRLEIEGLTAGQALEVVRQIGSGLQALHDRGVLHRDVKPANVLFRSVDPQAASMQGREPEVRAMLGDLGLGKALDVSSRLTMIAGTPAFVAPEQARGERIDGRADQYSLAALTHLMLAGRAPFDHANLSAAAACGPPPPLSASGREFAPEVEAVVRRALAPDPGHRFDSVAAYVAALREAAGELVAGGLPSRWLPVDPHLTQPGARPSVLPDRGPLPEPQTPAPRRRSRWVVAVAGVVALAVGATAGWWAADGAGDVTLTDTSGSLEVTVPEDWARWVAEGGWVPPESETSYPALSVGSTEDWSDPGTAAEGAFLGILPGTELPELMPGHPECGSSLEPVSEGGDEPSTTVVHEDCPGGVTVERVVQVAGNRLLWVQVRSADRATANRVLDGVGTSGL